MKPLMVLLVLVATTSLIYSEADSGEGEFETPPFTFEEFERMIGEGSERA